MADCYGCPYRWHDEDCEYCSAQNDMILDLKSIKKENCPIYKEYEENRRRERAASGGSSSGSSSSSSSSSYSSSGNGGCIGCGVVIVILALILTLISTGTISFGTKKVATSSTSAAQTAIVYNVDEAANMRDKPGGENELIVSIPKGETVEILDKSGQWWLVKYGDYEGYCNSKYLDIQD